jgi:hypothetical protein
MQNPNKVIITIIPSILNDDVEGVEGVEVVGTL